MMRRTARLSNNSGVWTPYLRMNDPTLNHSDIDSMSPKKAYSRFNHLLPKLFQQFKKFGFDETRRKIAGYKVYDSHGYYWPEPLMTKRGGKWGWNQIPRPEGMVPYRTHAEKMYETGELEYDSGEMYPDYIMQTWFGKRPQQRRQLTWGDARAIRRIHPHVYRWAPEVTSVHVYSELLEHQFAPAIEHDALNLMESYGGIDQWVLQNDPMYLQSWEMEKMRNYLLVRRMEMAKNHVMEEQAQALAAHLFDQLKERAAHRQGAAAPAEAAPEAEQQQAAAA
eukprot:TRINITY_DN8723_c1_g1_i2.p2 TRINITY_DN8723_c1_g1~~TRINITY_DN8723_c1_g1_i2.p2  ORF type:complete len:280 (+),score=125.18 TRINITY_DN8723_c1_g1_i2:151-990(+)